MPVSPPASALTPATAKPPKTAPAMGAPMLPDVRRLPTFELTADPLVKELARAFKLAPLSTLPPPMSIVPDGRCTPPGKSAPAAPPEAPPKPGDIDTVMPDPVPGRTIPDPEETVPTVLAVMPPANPTELILPPTSPWPPGWSDVAPTVYREHSPRGTQIVLPLCSASA